MGDGGLAPLGGTGHELYAPCQLDLHLLGPLEKVIIGRVTTSSRRKLAPGHL
jgi:hypothetical protein